MTSNLYVILMDSRLQSLKWYATEMESLPTAESRSPILVEHFNEQFSWPCTNMIPSALTSVNPLGVSLYFQQNCK